MVDYVLNYILLNCSCVSSKEIVDYPLTMWHKVEVFGGV